MFIYFKCSTNPYIGFSRLDLESAVNKTQVNNALSVFLNMFSQNVNTLEMDRDDSRDCELASWDMPGFTSLSEVVFPTCI